MDLLELVSVVGLGVLVLNVAMCLVRAVRGPTAFDRIMALEAVNYNLTGAVLLVSIHQRTNAFVELILVVGLLGFLGTVVLTAYAARRR